MSQIRLWVAYQTPAKTFGPSRVSIEGCEYVDDLFKQVKKVFEIPAPPFHLTLYQPDGKTEIKPTTTLQLLQDAGKDGDTPFVVKTLSFALNTEPTIVQRSPLIGQVFSVSINQNKLIKKYLTPTGSTPSTPVESSPTSIDLPSLGLQLEQLMFYKNTTARPCIVVDVEPRPLEALPEEPPTITIVLITGFDGRPLDQVMCKEEFNRVIPIRPTPSLPGTAAPINTNPEWIPHSKRKVPSYILCIPIKVYPQNLRRLEDPVQLDEQNLQRLKLHILALGGINANADFEDSEEDESESDDDVVVRCEDFNRIVRWDEIAV